MDDLKKELQSMHEEQQSDLADSLKEINELANKAYQAKLYASAKDKEANELKSQLAALMETAKVDKISADDCTVSGKIKSSVSVPKDHGDKLELFKLLMSKDNLDSNGKPVISTAITELAEELLRYPVLLEMLTINATTFSSWYNTEQEVQIASGNIDWSIPFIKAYERYSIGFRKRSKK